MPAGLLRAKFVNLTVPFALHEPHDTAGEVKVVDSFHRGRRAVVIAIGLDQ
jgi:hypothetical protein